MKRDSLPVTAPAFELIRNRARSFAGGSIQKQLAEFQKIVFHHIPASASDSRGLSHILAFANSDDDDFGVRENRFDLLGCGKAVRVLHPDVHEYPIRLMSGVSCEGLAAVGAFMNLPGQVINDQSHRAA